MSYWTHEFEIGIDVDDVLVPCHQRVWDVAEEVLGYKVSCENMPLRLDAVLPKEDCARVWAAIDATPGWNAPPITPEVAEALAGLRLYGHVVAITAPHCAGTWMNDRMAWLLEQGFEKDDIIQTSGKFRVPVDVFIDDLPANLSRWRERNRYLGVALLWSAPHNLSTPCPLSVQRVGAWEEVYKAVRRAKEAWRVNRLTRAM